MTLATVNPTLSTPEARPHNAMTATRGLVVAALLALPLASVATATAASESPISSKAQIEHGESEQVVLGGQRDAHAAQQQAYLDGLERAAKEAATSSPSARAAFAAQQTSYVEHLAQAARRSRSDALDVQSASSTVRGETGDDVSIPVATLLAIGGMALGTGATVASRRLPLPRNRRLAV